MIIDAHAHITNKHGKTVNIKPEDLAVSMERAEIDYSIILANQLWGPGGILNQEAVEIAKRFPQFKPVARISLDSIDKDLKEAESYFKEGLIYGLKFYPGYQDFNPADGQMDRAYKLAQKYGKPIMFHTGALLMGSSGVLRQSHPLNIDDVANKFPGLKIIMAHAGNPWILDAAAVVAKQPNVYVDLSGYFTEWQSINEQDANYFIEDFTKFGWFVGDFKKVLFGTDYPLYDQKEYLEVVQRLRLSDEERELVFWKNAKELFGI